MGNQKDYHEKEPAANAEGQHGNMTHAQFIQQLHEGEHRELSSDRANQQRDHAASEGSRRLVEDREQHDEAEKNSEITKE